MQFDAFRGQQVLGKGAEREWRFPSAVGDSFQHRGVRFEVIARLALLEDGDATELTVRAFR